MKCPVCKDRDLVMSERSGIEIDYCPECRGVWLDRGELDKIIERSQSNMQENYREPAPQREYREKEKIMDKKQAEKRIEELRKKIEYHAKKYYDDDYKYHNQYGHYGKHKKRNFLSDIFDFD